MRVGFALLSNSSNPLPSTRIACLNLFPHLRSRGLEPQILLDPPLSDEVPEVGNLARRALEARVDVVVFQKMHGQSVLAAMSDLKAAGVPTIYCVCDFVDNEMASVADATIVVTDYLKSLYKRELHERIYVIHDGIERPDVIAVGGSDRQPGGRRLKAALVTALDLYRIPIVGTPPPGWCVEVVGRFPKRRDRLQRFNAARWRLARTEGMVRKMRLLHAMLHPAMSHVAWSAEEVYSRLATSDVGIIPVDTSDDANPHAPVPSWKTKSENRLTLKMAIGLPVIATPIPSYEAIIEHGVNGFFAQSRGDWLHCFAKLRDPELRREMGRHARQSVLTRYSQNLQAQLFVDVLHQVIRKGRSTAFENTEEGDKSSARAVP